MSGGPSSDSNNPQRLTEKKKAENALIDLFGNFSLTEGQVVAPPRKTPGTLGRPVNIDTNIYQIKTENRCVYRYDVSVTGQSRRGKEVDLTKRSESSAVIAGRIDVCREAFLHVFRTYDDIFGTDEHAVYYDLQSILYTLKPLEKLVGTAPVQLIVERSEQVTLPGNLERVVMDIKNVREEAQRIQLDDLSALINEETLARDRSVLNFIELAVNQHPMFNNTEFLTLKGSMAFFLNGAAHGLPEKELDRGGTKYLASGVQKSATLIEGFKDANSDPKQRKMGLLLEAKHSPFHSTMPLLDCIKKHGGTEAMYQGFIRGQLTDQQLNQLTRVYKKTQLMVHYPNGQSRKIELKSFDMTTANSHQITDLNKNVADYFHEKYEHPLNHPDAHLVCVKQGTQRNFYPAEFLHIADNQVVTAEQMDAASKASMIRACAVRPDIMKQENDRAAKAIQLHESAYTGGAEIKFSKKTLGTASRILPTPTVTYNRGGPLRIGPTEAYWRMGAFYKVSGCKDYAIYTLQNNRSDRFLLTSKELESFDMEIQRFSERSGLKLGKCKDSGVYSDMDVEECVKYCKENGIALCFFITPENIKSCHSVMKMCEHRYNIVTQDLQVKTARKMLQRGASATLENYMAKTNIKLGGLNHVIQHENPDIQSELETTMFVGIATNQPGSKSIVDRVRSGIDEKPGVLGYCANFGDNFNEFIGDFFYTQAYRPEFYGDLREIFKICVQRFTNKRKSAPKKIIFYYTGLTEGQFESAYKYAIPLIKDGIREGNGGNPIALTLVAVQKMNNVRLFPLKFPSNGKDHEFNVAHGTVVDTTIVHPVFPEFYLMAHSALKGTGRVPRYTIVLDENNYSLDILEGVTHCLSYEHQIVARTTSLPTPVYVAEGYANRGRDVYNAESFEHNKDLPRTDDGFLNLRALSEQLNYSKSDLADFRVNA